MSCPMSNPSSSVNLTYDSSGLELQVELFLLDSNYYFCGAKSVIDLQLNQCCHFFV